ncbi:hypothetical protein BJX63DRAFT_439854 [Aspergillus granulosus]|uniref:Rhodopsin domain-containing protein n=1 Tax=Aspergillus granulosus TaxID=176169 RepID=A0ABR4HSS4_9EURO
MQDIGDSAAGRSRAILISAVIVLVLPLMTVALRCFCRIRIVAKGFGWDDASMVLAVICNTLFAICAILGPLHGVGRRLADIASPADLQESLWWWWIAQPMYIFSGVFMKVSISITLWQLTVFRAHRLVLLATVITATIPSIVLWLLMMFQCTPVSRFWRRDTPGTCLDPNPLIIIFYVYGALGALNDLSLSIIPIHLVWNLRLEARTRVAVAVILSLGGIACLSSIARLPFISMYKDADLLYNATTFIILFLVESGLGIIAASIPTLRPLLDRDVSLRLLSREPRRRAFRPNHSLSISGQRDPSGSAKALSSCTQQDLEELHVLNSESTARLGFGSDSLERPQAPLNIPS